MNAAKKTNPEKWKFKLREMNLIKKNRIKKTLKQIQFALLALI